LQESAAGVLITSKVMMVAQTRQHSLWEKELAERGGIEIASKVGRGMMMMTTTTTMILS
jgi:hypothetical protein